MIIREIIWKDEFVDKLADKQNVSIEEAEEVLNSKPHIRKIAKGRVKDENVYTAFGQTGGGRFLVVIYIKKRTGGILPISARDMDKGERDYYGKQKESN